MTCRRISFMPLIAVLLFLLTSVPSFAWKFASITDSQGGSTPINIPVLSKIVSRINSEGADLVLFHGDATESAPDETTHAAWIDTWKVEMNKLNCPWYSVPGNHDIISSGSQALLRQKLSMPLNGPSGDEEMAYSFDHQNAHFVGLNCEHWGNRHRVQRDWLSADLAKTSQPHVFVMAHEPGYPVGSHIGDSLDVYPSERDDFWNRMTAGRVNIYFSGHEHLYHRSKHGSIYQVINSSCGGVLRSAPGAISGYSYVIVEVNGYDVTCTAKDSNGKVIDSWIYSVPSSSLPQLSLSLLADKSTVASGDVITYSITYTNKGTAAAANARVSIRVPSYTTYLSGSAGSGVYNSSSNTVVWTVPSVAAGASGTFLMKVKVQ